MKPLQPRLFPTPSRSKETKPSQAAMHAKRNQDAAAAILADAERYGGESAGLVQWARKIQEPPISAPEGRKD